MRVVIVEDDHDLREGLANYLRLCGVDVHDVGTGLELYRSLLTRRFDVAILDVNLPDADGYDLVRDLSAEGWMGLIMLTGRAGRDDRVRGYAEGADLYLSKPVDGEELLHAVRNLARRLRAVDGRHAEGLARPGVHRTAGGVWRLDVLRQCLVPPGRDAIALSGREMMLLERLARADGATVSRAVLAGELGYDAANVEGRGFDAVVRRLRRKASDRGVELPLRALHAVGIRFTAPLSMV